MFYSLILSIKIANGGIRTQFKRLRTSIAMIACHYGITGWNNFSMPADKLIKGDKDEKIWLFIA